MHQCLGRRAGGQGDGAEFAPDLVAGEFGVEFSAALEQGACFDVLAFLAEEAAGWTFMGRRSVDPGSSWGQP